MASGVPSRRFFTYMGVGRWVLYCSLGDEENKLWERKQGGDGIVAF